MLETAKVLVPCCFRSLLLVVDWEGSEGYKQHWGNM